MTSSVMASHSSRNAVWYAKNKHCTGGPNSVALLMKKLFDQNRIEDAKRASEDKEYRIQLMKELGIN